MTRHRQPDAPCASRWSGQQLRRPKRGQPTPDLDPSREQVRATIVSFNAARRSDMAIEAADGSSMVIGGGLGRFTVATQCGRESQAVVPASLIDSTVGRRRGAHRRWMPDTVARRYIVDKEKTSVARRFQVVALSHPWNGSRTDRQRQLAAAIVVLPSALPHGEAGTTVHRWRHFVVQVAMSEGLSVFVAAGSRLSDRDTGAAPMGGPVRGRVRRPTLVPWLDQTIGIRPIGGYPVEHGGRLPRGTAGRGPDLGADRSGRWGSAVSGTGGLAAPDRRGRLPLSQASVARFRQVVCGQCGGIGWLAL